MISDKPRIYPELLNSMRFYSMMGIVLIDKGYSEKEATRALTEFLKDLKDSGDYSNRVIQANMNVAYQTFPTDFCKIFNLPSVRDDIKIHDKGY